MVRGRMSAAYGLIIAASMLACSSTNRPWMPTTAGRPRSVQVLAQARACVRERMGDSLFAEAVAPAGVDPFRVAQDGVFLVDFRFAPGAYPWVDERITVPVGWKGVRSSDPRLYGLPACPGSPADWVFAVSEEDALRIAREAGLAPGSAPWTARFRWAGKGIERYVWAVGNVTRRDCGGIRLGDTILVDAVTGVVLKREGWYK
jgi:hypothetical protein